MHPEATLQGAELSQLAQKALNVMDALMKLLGQEASLETSEQLLSSPFTQLPVLASRPAPSVCCSLWQSPVNTNWQWLSPFQAFLNQVTCWFFNLGLEGLSEINPS